MIRVRASTALVTKWGKASLGPSGGLALCTLVMPYAIWHNAVVPQTDTVVHAALASAFKLHGS